ncbi:hypothetical protein Hdeb2414_s0002g00073921 [Helianthus debilis subsp. tardiflorus]
MRSGAVCPSMAPAKRRAHQYAGRYESKMRGWRDVYSGMMCGFVAIEEEEGRQGRGRILGFLIYGLWASLCFVFTWALD